MCQCWIPLQPAHYPLHAHTRNVSSIACTLRSPQHLHTCTAWPLLHHLRTNAPSAPGTHTHTTAAVTGGDSWKASTLHTQQYSRFPYTLMCQSIEQLISHITPYLNGWAYTERLPSSNHAPCIGWPRMVVGQTWLRKYDTQWYTSTLLNGDAEVGFGSPSLAS